MLLDPLRRLEAWEYFYEHYRSPVAALFRSRGIPDGDVDDLVQSFFLKAMQQDFLDKADPHKGRFRGYLRTAAHRFAISHFRKSGRRKKVSGPNSRLYRSAPPGPSPEEAFDQAWARALLDRSRRKAWTFLASRGKARYADPFELRERGLTWQEVADQVGTTPDTARAWVRYVREVFMRCLNEEIAATASGTSSVNLELNELWSLLKPTVDATPSPPQGLRAP
jgi:RNA polymerase sigma factor (sigma-70 family)